MPNFAAHLEDQYQALCDQDTAWETHVEDTRDEFELALCRLARLVRAGDDKKRHEMLDKFVGDTSWDMGALIAETLRPNATVESLRKWLDVNVFTPAIMGRAEQTWKA